MPDGMEAIITDPALLQIPRMSLGRLLNLPPVKGFGNTHSSLWRFS